MIWRLLFLYWPLTSVLVAIAWAFMAPVRNRGGAE